MDFPGQKRQQEMLQYSLACSFAIAVIAGVASHSVKAGWYVYLFGLFFTWLVNIVEWDYFLCEPGSWREGKYLDVPGYWEMEGRDRQIQLLEREQSPKQRSQITMSGGPGKMTISSKALPERTIKKWSGWFS